MSRANDLRSIVGAATSSPESASGPFTEDIIDGMEQADVVKTLNHLTSIRNKNQDAATRVALRRAVIAVFVFGILLGALGEHVRLAIWFNPISRLCDKLDQAAAAKSILEAIKAK